MDNVLTAANWLMPLLYLWLVIDYGATFFLGVRTHVRTPWLLAVIAAHAGMLVMRGIRLGCPPLVTNLDLLTAMAMATAVVYWFLELLGRDRRAGLFVFGLAFLFQYTSSVFTADPAAAGPGHAASVQTGLHTASALLANTALSFAGVYGLLYLVARQNLKPHHIGLFFDRLPPLELLGRMTWLALVVGFAFTTISIATGPLLLAGGSGAVWRPKVVLKIVMGSVAWLVCFSAVVGRAAGKWSPARVAAVAVIDFLVIMALLVASAVMS